MSKLLEGVPDYKESLTNEEYTFWHKVKNTYAEINGRTPKKYTREQILKWYNKQRQKEGIEAARRAGKHLGRPPSVSDWELFDRTAKRWVNGEITAAVACRITGRKKTSWYKYTKNRGFVKGNDEYRTNP